MKLLKLNTCIDCSLKMCIYSHICCMKEHYYQLLLANFQNLQYDALNPLRVLIITSTNNHDL